MEKSENNLTKFVAIVTNICYYFNITRPYLVLRRNNIPRKLYIETRLYNVNNRLASLDLCERIDGWIDQGLLKDMIPCFLPNRDNPIEEDVKDVSKAIFEIDIALLRSCSGVVGYFDGPHWDAGCAFEIGCGWAWGHPVNLITTDFYKWSVGDSSESYFVSKLVQHIAKVIAIHDYNFAIADFRERCNELLERAMTAFQHNLINDFGTIKPPRPALEAAPVVYDYYLDPNFKYSESGKILLESIISMIKAANKTCIVGNNQGDITADINNLRQSGQAVFFTDPYEPNVDSSILHGIAYGIGRRPVLYSGSVVRYDAGAFSGSRNVMIENSAAAVVYSLGELESLIKKQ